MATSETGDDGRDRAQLDADLNVWAHTPDHMAFLNRWKRDSQLARTRTQVLRDQGYGRSSAERMDIFPVRGARAAPVLVFIHGGGWQSQDKSDVAFLAPPLVERGIGFVALNHELAPRIPMPQMVRQVHRALGVLHYQGARWGFDPARIFVAGHGAGGHLAATAMAAGTADSGPGAGTVAGGLALSGIYDLEPVRRSYQQPTLGLDADDVAALSPARNLPDSAGPLLLAVGAAETGEFRRQQAAFLAAWQAAGLRGQGMELPNRHHFSTLDALTQPDDPLFRALVDLVTAGELP